MLSGEGDVVTGWKDKIMLAAANITPSETLVKQHSKMAEPDGAHKE